MVISTHARIRRLRTAFDIDIAGFYENMRIAENIGVLFIIRD